MSLATPLAFDELVELPFPRRSSVGVIPSPYRFSGGAAFGALAGPAGANPDLAAALYRDTKKGGVPVLAHPRF
jgi:hypothetical protein